MDNLLSMFKHITRKPILRWFAVAYIVVVLIGGFAAYVRESQLQITEESWITARQTFDRIRELQEKITKRLNKLENDANSFRVVQEIDPKRLDATIKAIERIESLPDDQISPLLARVAALDQETSRLAGEFKEIRSALSPTEPEEILTVARLGDKFELFLQKIRVLEDKIEQLRKDVDAKVQHNFEQVNAQVDRIVGMLQWLGLLIVPVILNTIRDFIRVKGKETEHGPEVDTPE